MQNNQLQQRNNLNKLLRQLDPMVLEDELKRSLVLVMQRLNTELPNVNDTIADIASEFPYLKLQDIINSLRKGSLGNYGRTYKLSTQEICVWIRKNTENKNTLTI